MEDVGLDRDTETVSGVSQLFTLPPHHYRKPLASARQLHTNHIPNG
jgi:hypothetical protein